jgi:four helix bundle protein
MGKDIKKQVMEEKDRFLSTTSSNLGPHSSNNVYIFPFEKLDVWQMAVELVDYVLDLLEKISFNKHLRLISQMEGAITSVPQNIAEGKGRQYKKEFIQFLSIAQGSLYEAITLNEIFHKRDLFSDEEYKEIRKRGENIDRKLNGLMNSLKGKKRDVEGGRL